MKHHLYGCQPLANRNPLAINVAAAMKSAISHRVIVQSPRIVGSTTLWSAEKPEPQAWGLLRVGLLTDGRGSITIHQQCR
jgi:hypothetical protein